MFAAAIAALPLRIPVAHIHGGELTQGAMDDAMRHSITKLSPHSFPLPLPSMPAASSSWAKEPWRVHTATPRRDSILVTDAIPAPS